MDEKNYFENLDYPRSAHKQAYVMVALDKAVIFPGQLLSIDIPRGVSATAMLTAIETNREVFVAFKRTKSETPARKDICEVGTIAKIKQMVKLPSDGVRVLALGLTRMRLSEYISYRPYFEVTLEPFIADTDDEIVLAATKNAVREKLKAALKVAPKLFDKDVSIDNHDEFVAEMSNVFYSSTADKYELLAMPSLAAQLEDICVHIVRHCEIASLEKEIEIKVRKNIDKSQHDYFLREKIKAIHEELGEDEDEVGEYRKRVAEKNLPDYAREKAEKEINKLRKMAPTSPESAVSRGYLDLILELPWGELTEAQFDLDSAAKILDEDHYGLEKVKERILEYLAVQSLKKDMSAPTLCFVGPPGVGKTSIVSSIARAANRHFITVSLGGVRDEAEIRGHRRTYIGSLPGRIIAGLRDAGVSDPVFLLDEIDKMTSDFRGDPASALLEVLDSKQNGRFKDHYLEMPYDLSKVMFITTANTIDTIAPPLLDRMEVIELTGYTYDEKLQIAKQYLIPKQCEANGVDPACISFTDSALLATIQRYTRESGVRNLEREVATVIRKAAVKIVKDKKRDVKDSTGGQRFKITEKNLVSYLGIEKFREEQTSNEDECGAATGLAWTGAGGVTLDVEVAVIPGGKGEVRISGNLGEVMKESVFAALSVVRVRAEMLGIDKKLFTENDIHVHFPAAATPKDGPSAGITITTAIASALSGKKVAADVAMTGEVTLRGKVLPIGGLKEKSLAALRYGKKRLIIPIGNEKELDEIPKEVKQGMQIIRAKTIDEVFEAALV